MAVPVSDLQLIAPSAIIELFQLEINAAQHGVNETYYFHAGTDATGSNDDIVWDGQAYLAFPIEATEFEYTGTGSLPRPKLRVSNIYGTITGLILSLPNGLEGAKVTRIRTLARYLDAANFPVSGDTLLTEDGDALLLEDGSSILLEPLNPTEDPTAEFPREIYYIDRKASENRDLIEFELAAAFDLVGVRAPKRQCVGNVCQWAYRGPECGYTGDAYFNFNDVPVAAIGQDVCGKRLRSCELRFAQQRFAGSVTLSSNVITLGQPVSFSTGDPVSGFGLPTGTTVSSVSNNLVTVSQNATASSSGTTTGTIQSNFNQIIVTSATGLGVGMTVTGNYLQPNTQITAISGATLTLSVAIDFTQFLTLATTFTGYPNPYHLIRGGGNATSAVYYLFVFPPFPSFAVGQYISSSLLPLSARAKISSLGSVFGYRILNLDKTFTYSKFPTTWTLYNASAIPSATYTFTATDPNYTFRANSSIPYGSYPGIGAFTT
jgi:phage-related protein